MLNAAGLSDFVQCDGTCVLDQKNISYYYSWLYNLERKLGWLILQMAINLLLLFGAESDCHSHITKGWITRNSFMDETVW